jgi:hypothetical protein
MKHVKWVEEAIERNPRDASARMSLLRMLRDAGDAARLDRARREFAAVLPLPPALWLEWLEERLAALRAAAADPASEAFQQCAGDVMELSDRSVTLLCCGFAALSPVLCGRAVQDWPHAVALWQAKLGGLQLLSLAARGFDLELLREAFEEALGHVGHHVGEGHAVWALYLAWEEELEGLLVGAEGAEAEAAAETQTQKVRALYSRALHAPLEGLEQLWTSYEAWECEEKKKAGLQKRRAGGEAALAARRPWEQKVAELTGIDQGQNTTLWNALSEYLSFEESQLGGKKERGKRDPASGVALFDRGFAVFGAVPELWLRFLSFLCKWTPAESWPAWASRARRHCPWSGAVLAAAARVTATGDTPAALSMLGEALAGNGCLATADDFHAAYCAYEDLLPSGAGAAEAAAAHLGMLEQHFGDRSDLRAETLEHLAALALRAGDTEQFHARWEAALKAQGSAAWDPWSRYLFSCPLSSPLEVTRCRSLFKRAAHAVLDNPAGVFEAWRRWERRWGTSETQLEASCALERRGRAVAALRAQWQKKEAENAPAAEPPQRAQPKAEPKKEEEKKNEATEEERTRRTVFVRNIMFEAGEEQLRELFAPFGELKEVRLIRDATTGASKGELLVMFVFLLSCALSRLCVCGIRERGGGGGGCGSAGRTRGAGASPGGDAQRGGSGQLGRGSAPHAVRVQPALRRHGRRHQDCSRSGRHRQ